MKVSRCIDRLRPAAIAVAIAFFLALAAGNTAYSRAENETVKDRKKEGKNATSKVKAAKKSETQKKEKASEEPKTRTKKPEKKEKVKKDEKIEKKKKDEKTGDEKAKKDVKKENSGKGEKKGKDEKLKKDAAIKKKDEKTPAGATNEVVLNSTKFKLGGLTLEDNAGAKSSEKLENIKKLASEVKQNYDETQKKKPRKTNRYMLPMPSSYHEIDMKLAHKIMARVRLNSISMFKTLYQGHLRTSKLKKSGGKSAVKDEIDGRTKMALFIIGNFINEVIEKYDSGNLSKRHKDFDRWISEGSQILSYGSVYSAKIPVDKKSSKKAREKSGVIPLSVAKKLLKALIETESSGVQMEGGRVNVSLNMATYPNDGSYVIGFMQESVDDFSKGINLFDPEVNVKYTCKKLHKYLVKYGGNIDMMLRTYNAGAGNMDCAQAHRYSAKVMSKMSKY